MNSNADDKKSLEKENGLFKSYLQKTWPLQSKHMRYPPSLQQNQDESEEYTSSQWTKTVHLPSSLDPVIMQSHSEVSSKSNRHKVTEHDSKVIQKLPKVEIARELSSKDRGRLVPSGHSSMSNICSSPAAISHAAVSTMKGIKPGRPDWINQDSSFVMQTGRYMGEVYCVLDGHGEDGHLVSQLCKSTLPQLILTFPDDLKKAFSQMQGKILSSNEVQYFIFLHYYFDTIQYDIQIH